MNKPFLNIDQQIELLESRGLIVGEHADCDLLQNGYYTVINGYKQFFLDAEQCKAKNSEFFTRELLLMIFSVWRNLIERLGFLLFYTYRALS